MKEGSLFSPARTRDRDYHIGSNFWKFYFNRISFTLREPVSLVKVFRLFRLIGSDCFGVQSVNTIGRCTTYYLLAQGQQHVCDALFCFVVYERSTELGCFSLCSWCLWKALDEEGCLHGLGSMVFGLAVQKFLNIQ